MKDARGQARAEALGQLLRSEVDEAVRKDSTIEGQEHPAWQEEGRRRLSLALESRPVRDGAASAFSGRISVFLRAFVGGGKDSIGVGWARLRPGVMVALGMVALGVGILAAEWVSASGEAQPPGLTFSLGDGVARSTGRVIAPGEGTKLAFSDGSRLMLLPGSVLRVRETDARGAMVILEEGQVDSKVTHRSDSRWSLFAGPYEVRVVGTRFRTTWDPALQQVGISLFEGSVQVLGRGIEGTVELKPGQRFDGGPEAGGWAVRSVTAPEQRDGDPGGRADLPSRSTPAAEPEARGQEEGSGEDATSGAKTATTARRETTTVARDRAPGDARKGASSSKPETSTQAPGEDWSTLVSAGMFERVVREADAGGVARCLSTCGASDLRALADAARYTGRLSTAEDALLRLRELSPGDRARAGYLLGSVHESRGQMAAAREWYSRYLQEAPGGSLAAEARAGKMRVLSATGEVRAAKAAAREYLRLHPNGVGASPARKILERP